MKTRPFSTRPCTRPAICRISLAPRWRRVSTFLPRSMTFANRVSSMMTVSSPFTLSALCPAAVIERRVDAGEPLGDVPSCVLDGRAGWEKHPDAPSLPNELLQEPVAEELDGLL